MCPFHEINVMGEGQLVLSPKGGRAQDVNGRHFVPKWIYIYLDELCWVLEYIFLSNDTHAWDVSLPRDSTSEMQGCGLIHDNQREGNFIAQLHSLPN